MSFYVENQEEALQIGLCHFRPDLAKLSLKQLQEHPDVKIKREKLVNFMGFEDRHPEEAISLDVKDVPVILESTPFRGGYDIWAFSRKTGMGTRIGP